MICRSGDAEICEGEKIVFLGKPRKKSIFRQKSTHDTIIRYDKYCQRLNAWGRAATHSKRFFFGTVLSVLGERKNEMGR